MVNSGRSGDAYAKGDVWSIPQPKADADADALRGVAPAPHPGSVSPNITAPVKASPQLRLY